MNPELCQFNLCTCSNDDVVGRGCVFVLAVAVSETGVEAGVLACGAAGLLETGNKHISLNPNTTPGKLLNSNIY